ncbi:MAG: outer membrane beta-barrel protein [Bacteroidota bacterium]
MKKITLLIVFVLCSVAYVNAQSRIGGGFAYGTEIEEFGIQVNGEFFLKSDLAIAPDFNYFFAEDPVSFWTINADVHYYFSESGAVSLYGLGGFNLATISVDSDLAGSDNSSTEFGVNLGIGANFDINAAITPFTQLKFVISDFDQAVLAFGVRFPLN